MCIFSQPILSVNNTTIFARLSATGTQFLAYQMEYESQEENAMILPIPVQQHAGEGDCRFIDLSEYESFFDDLNDGFPVRQPRFNIGCSSSLRDSARGRLAVHNVGNYIASFVPKLEDMLRLDSRFHLPADTWAKVPQYADYGFAVFQLVAGAGKPHPMAFEFASSSSSVYFPTMHIHDGEVHQEEEFDHMLYLQHGGLDGQVYAYQNANVADRATGLVRSKYPAKEFCDVELAKGLVVPELLVHRKLIRGSRPNEDTELAVKGDPVKSGRNFRPVLDFAPWVVVGAALSWFFARRAAVRREERRD